MFEHHINLPLLLKNVNTCLPIESLKEYSNFVIKCSTERDKSGRRRLHEDTMFWVVCSVNNTLTTPLPCVHSSTSLPIHTFPFFLCNFYWSQAVEFRNKHKLLFASFFGCEITDSILSVLVFGYTVKLCYRPPVRVSEWMDWLKVVNEDIGWNFPRRPFSYHFGISPSELDQGPKSGVPLKYYMY